MNWSQSQIFLSFFLDNMTIMTFGWLIIGFASDFEYVTNILGFEWLDNLKDKCYVLVKLFQVE